MTDSALFGLELAIEAGDESGAAALLREAPSLSRRQSRGVPLPMALAFAGMARALALCMDFGIDPSMASPRGWTLLMCAAATGQALCAEELARRGADPSARSDTGKSACDIALAAGHTELGALLGAWSERRALERAARGSCPEGSLRM